VEPWLIVAVGVSSFVGFAFIVRKAIGARSQRSPAGGRGLVGSVGEAREELAPAGEVFIAGVTRRAVAQGGPIPRGAMVRVTGESRDGLTVELVRQHDPLRPDSRVPQS
jgi:membrane-bound ClpP family serine protease